MTPIISGTTLERIIRTVLLFALVDIFAVLYLWDGYVGYQRANASEFAKLLGLPAEPLPAVHPGLSARAAQAFVEEMKSGIDLERVSQRFGEPSVRQPDAAYYLGPGGSLKLELRGDRAQKAEWVRGLHSESDQQWQRWIGYVLAIVGLGATVQLARVLGTRVTLSDAGLHIAGRALIPFDAMTDLRLPASRRAGILELVYSLGGRNGVVRLDDYIIRDFDAIVAALCDRKGFRNPLMKSPSSG